MTEKEPGPWHLAGEVPGKVTHFDDGGLNHDTAYEHKVAAFGPAGESEAVVFAKATRTPRMTRPVTSKRDTPRIFGERRIAKQVAV